MAARRQTRSFGTRTLAALALAAGIVIALVDSRPGWDSTGITAGALLLAAGTAAFEAGDRPWVWALLIGLPTPIVEVIGSGNTGSILALGFATAGAAIGWTLRRAA
jgi:hypothetical protein